MYKYISFANYFHKWKERIQRGESPIRPDQVYEEWLNKWEDEYIDKSISIDQYLKLNPELED